MQQIADAYNRAVAASEAIFARDGDRIAHNERLVAVEAVLIGPGLDVGQVARGALHGDPQWQSKPQPPRDIVSPQCLAFLRRERLV